MEAFMRLRIPLTDEILRSRNLPFHGEASGSEKDKKDREEIEQDFNKRFKEVFSESTCIKIPDLGYFK